MHAKRLPQSICVRSLVLIAQAIFLLGTQIHTHTHTHKVTDATITLFHAMAPPAWDNESKTEAGRVKNNLPGPSDWRRQMTQVVESLRPAAAAVVVPQTCRPLADPRPTQQVTPCPHHHLHQSHHHSNRQTPFPWPLLR